MSELVRVDQSELTMTELRTLKIRQVNPMEKRRKVCVCMYVLKTVNSPVCSRFH